MRKRAFFHLVLFLLCISAFAQNQYRKAVKPTKNVILMIPDGTSHSVVSAARWYQIYNQLGGDRLAIDPYLCGVVKTYNSNSPIGDSAPTTSCYMTGYLSQAGNVGIYPAVDEVNDIFTVDAAKSYQPLATVLEAAKYDLDKSTGLVATVEFMHATPADCSSHHYNRNKYNYLASQIAGNNVDVVIAGGVDEMTPEIVKHLESKNTKIILNDIASFRDYDAEQNLWAIFEKMQHPYDIDRDSTLVPSLAEMTNTAIERLSKNENGFFLMVEGSQIDWAAHSNDAVTMITEYLAFDRAVQAAIEFAKKDGNTTVIVAPDHGNSGFSIGERSFKNYASRGLDDYFGKISQYKASGRKLKTLLSEAKPEEFKSIVKEYTNIDLTDDDLNILLSSKDFKGDYTSVSNNANLSSNLISIMNKETPFGFTTGGHTGEDVFLAAYHPNGDVPMGMNTNIELNKYLCDVIGLNRPLDDITDEIFAKHTEVFDGLTCSIDTTSTFPVLTVKKGEKRLVVPAFQSVATLDGKPFDIGSVTVYIDKNDTFYLPKSLRNQIDK